MSETHVNTQENIILIDWFSFSSQIDDVDTMIRLLGLDTEGIPWQTISGMYGYKSRKYYEGINIHYDPRDKDGYSVWVELSGQGCRAFEQYSNHKDWFTLISLVTKDTKSYCINRLDIAYDDHSGILDIFKMDDELRKQNIVSKFKSYGVERSYTSEDITLYFGSKKSDVLFRCYNKAAERGREDEGHWIRFEIQLRDLYALKFLQEFYSFEDLGKVFSGVLNHYLRFVKPGKDSNKSRWSVRPWWKKFVDSASDISLYTEKGTDYNEYKLHEFVINNVGNAIDTFVTIFGEDKLFSDLKKRRVRLSPKYRQLIDNHKLRQAQDNPAAILKELGVDDDF